MAAPARCSLDRSRYRSTLRQRSRRSTGTLGSVSTTAVRSFGSTRAYRNGVRRDPRVGRAGFEPATRGLKAPCSDLAELPPLRTILGTGRAPRASHRDTAPALEVTMRRLAAIPIL